MSISGDPLMSVAASEWNNLGPPKLAKVTGLTLATQNTLVSVVSVTGVTLVIVLKALESFR